MNTKGLQKHYDKLTDLERFRLALAASERDDDELRALRESTPKVRYVMLRWQYTRQFDAIQTVADAATKMILYNGWLATLSWGLEHASPDRDRPPDADVITAWAVLAMWDALAVFCEELGITVEQALTFSAPVDVLTQVVDFAMVILATNEDILHIFTEVHCRETGGDVAEIDAKREANLAEQHDAAVSEHVADLRRLWVRRLGG